MDEFNVIPKTADEFNVIPRTILFIILLLNLTLAGVSFPLQALLSPLH